MSDLNFYLLVAHGSLFLINLGLTVLRIRKLEKIYDFRFEYILSKKELRIAQLEKELFSYKNYEKNDYCL